MRLSPAVRVIHPTHAKWEESITKTGMSVSLRNAVAASVLRDHFQDVARTILNPGAIAAELFAMGIVSDSVLEAANKETPQERSRRLVNEMLRAVENNAECLMKIVGRSGAVPTWKLSCAYSEERIRG